MSSKPCPGHAKLVMLERIAENDYSCPHCGIIILDSDDDDLSISSTHEAISNVAMDVNSLISEESDCDEADADVVKFDCLKKLGKLISRNKTGPVGVSDRSKNNETPSSYHVPEKHLTFPVSDLFTEDEDSDSDDQARANHGHQYGRELSTFTLSTGQVKRKAPDDYSSLRNKAKSQSSSSSSSTISASKFYQKESLKTIKRIAHSPKSKRASNLESRNKAIKNLKFAELKKSRSKEGSNEIKPVFKIGQSRQSPKQRQLNRAALENVSAIAKATSSFAKGLTTSTFKISKPNVTSSQAQSIRRNVNDNAPSIQLKKRPAGVPMRSRVNRHAALLDAMKSSKTYSETEKKEEEIKKKESGNILDDILGPASTTSSFFQPTIPARQKSNPTPTISAAQSGNEPKKIRFSQTEFDIAKVIEAKRENRQIAEKENVKKIENFHGRRQETTSSFGTSGHQSIPSHPSLKSQMPSSRRLPPQPHIRHETKAFNSDPILVTILSWNVNWFDQFSDSNVPPPLSPKECRPLKLSYDSVAEYQDSYIPLMLHESWAEIVDDYWRRKSEFHGHNVMELFVSSNYGTDKSFLNISCQVAMKKDSLKDNYHAAEGFLTMLELSISDPDDKVRKIGVFAYVNEFTVEEINPNTNMLSQIVLPPGPCYLLKYELKIVKIPVRIMHLERIKMKPVCYLKPTLRKFEVILAMDNLKISQDIIKPRELTCKFSLPTNMPKNDEYNEFQNKAIIASIEAVNRPALFSKLLLIQGPPGTGKTHTLVGIIKQLYLTWENQEKMPRILICAPSNGAIDEIGRRLYKEKNFLMKAKVRRPLRLLRIGQPGVIHDDVKKITVEYLTATNIEKNKNDQKLKMESKTNSIEKKIADLDQKMADFRAIGNKVELKKAEEEMNRLARELNRGNEYEKRVVPSDVGQDVKKTRVDLINHVDVVLTTLNSSRQSLIQLLYTQNGTNAFNCVIVDEASQCTEPELMMPLAHGMNKVILIGDPMQLPATVISKKAADFQFGRSLFERLFQYFGGYEGNKETLLMLNQQYRMHSDICAFPSQHFYSNRLISHQSTNRQFPITPYCIIDVTDTQENTNNPSNKFNELEAEFVLKVVKAIDTLIPRNSTLGIITPYQGQKKLFNDKLHKISTIIKPEVNTIDGFQGQERDVIIISCVRASDFASVGFLKSKQRMNVALTRAKHSLIICISGKSLECDSNWKALLDDAKQRRKYYRTASTIEQDKITMIVQHKK